MQLLAINLTLKSYTTDRPL